ncbi:hypothetical protein [uncultured Microbacterium sp.]|uniref:hypothetical protein n=1 Tax=uncultured Microbacterium sp. TaxID=191216 RepID=UPI0025F9C88D|nr:hypothetical protein [uncultured Microbacterium sp.]
MSGRIDVQLGPLADHAQVMEASAGELESVAQKLETVIAAMTEQTSGAAADAAASLSTRALIETRARAARLRRNAATIRALANHYEACDVASARALGE